MSKQMIGRVSHLCLYLGAEFLSFFLTGKSFCHHHLNKNRDGPGKGLNSRSLKLWRPIIYPLEPSFGRFPVTIVPLSQTRFEFLYLDVNESCSGNGALEMLSMEQVVSLSLRYILQIFLKLSINASHKSRVQSKYPPCQGRYHRHIERTD